MLSIFYVMLYVYLSLLLPLKYTHKHTHGEIESVRNLKALLSSGLASRTVQ